MRFYRASPRAPAIVICDHAGCKNRAVVRVLDSVFCRKHNPATVSGVASKAIHVFLLSIYVFFCRLFR